MRRDLRSTALYREIETFHEMSRRPGTGQISDAGEVHLSPDGSRAVFTGTIIDTLEGPSPTRICQIDLKSGDTRVLTFGPNTDRLPKYSPEGVQIAFLSDRHRVGNFQLYLFDPVGGDARPTRHVNGWVEYLHWSPDGGRILLGVAGDGADLAGVQGGTASQQVADDVPSWMPAVESGEESYRWRQAWVYDLASGRSYQISRPGSNIWETVWCGSENIAAVVSPDPLEGSWYGAHLEVINIRTGNVRKIHTATDRQLGWLAASPSGDLLAFVEAICSDRWLVAGEVRLCDTSSGEVQRIICIPSVDIAYTEWRSEGHLLLAGHRGFEAVVGVYEVISDTFTEVWASHERSTAGPHIAVSGYGTTGDCVLVSESFVQAPEIALIRQGKYQRVKSFDLGYTDQVKTLGAVVPLSWRAPDGLEVQGWLLRPAGNSSVPLVMNVHGGPVWHWRPMWLGRGGAHIVMLVRRGYGVFLPNPRGSSGRGQHFARHVVGEMGGADTIDCLSGLDYLVKQGAADPKRLAVTGFSYGGFMCSWLVTQDTRFAAAVSVAPITNHLTEHLVSNIPNFVALFLADTYTNRSGKYFERSPVMYAHKVKTPMLNICGALDRCTPPGEAVQFHRALLQNGVKSVLVTYPEEGHGIRKLPANIDYAARVVAWIEEHMPAGDQASNASA